MFRPPGSGPVALAVALWAALEVPAADRYRFEASGFLHLPDPGEATEGAAVADMDGDGIPDAILSLRADPPVLRTCLAEAPLRFRPVQDLPVDAAGFVFAAELTGDGIPDAVVLQAQPDGVLGIFRGLGASGFEPLISHAIPALAGPEALPEQVLVRDVDGDLSPDLVLAAGGTFVVYAPSFASVQAVSGFASGAAVLDADGDGRLDLLLAVGSQYRSFELLRQMAPRDFEGFALEAPGQGPLALAPGPGGGKWILASTPGGAQAMALRGGAGTWRLDVVEPELLPPETSADAFGDLDGDSIVDCVRLVDSDDTVRAHFGAIEDGALHFSEEPAVGWISRSRWWLGRLAIEDVDGDGLPDVTLGPEYLIESPDRSFQSSARIDDGGYVWSLSPLEVNGDGKADLLVNLSGSSSIYLGGPGGFSAEIPLELAAPPVLGTRLDPAGPTVLLDPNGERVRGYPLGPDASLGAEFTLASFPGRVGSVGVFGEDEPWGPSVVTTSEDGTGGLRLSILSPTSATSAVVTDGFVLPGGSGGCSAADLEGDGYVDAVWGMARGAGIVRGGPGGLRPYLAAVPIPVERNIAMVALDVDGNGTSEVLAAGLPRVGSGYATDGHLISRDPGGSWSSRQVSAGGRTMAAGDLDSDGDPDVATTGEVLRLFRNQGAAGFGEAEEIDLGQFEPGPIAILDLDRDGFQDIACSDRSGVIVSYGEADGSHASSIRVADRRQPSAQLVPVNPNGGSQVDVLVVYSRGANELLLQQMDGTFSKTTLEGELGNARLVLVGDFDADGWEDLYGWSSDRGALFHGNGDGTYAAPQAIAGGWNLPCFAGDLEPDGDTDMVLRDWDGSLSLRRGGFEVLTAPNEPLGVSVSAFRSGTMIDLNADELQDIVVTSDLDQFVLPGRTDGTLGAPLEIPFPVIPDAARLIAPLDGDLFPDAIGRRGNDIVVCVGRGDFTFEQIPGEPLAQGGVPSALVPLAGQDALALIVTGWSGWASAAWAVFPGLGGTTFGEPVVVPVLSDHFGFDANADGLADVLVFRDDTIRAVLASRDLMLEGPRIHASGLHPVDMAQGDLDGDGAEELLVAWGNGTLGVLEGAPGRRATVAWQVPLPGGPQDRDLWVAAGDLDGDGRDDAILLQDGVLWRFRSLGGFSFAEAERVAEDVPGAGLHPIDLNRDGRLDVLVGGVTSYLGRGDGTLGLMGSFCRAGETGAVATTGDFTGDGIPDAAVFYGAGGTVALLEGDGRGGFRASEYLPGDEGPALAPTVGDFDGDGLMDVVVASSWEAAGPAAPTRPWYGVSGGAFRRGDRLCDPLSTEDGSVGLKAIDLDGDGREDLLALDRRGHILASLGGPEGLRPASLATFAPDDPAAFGAADFDGDGAHDVVVVGGTGLFWIPGLREAQAGLAFRRGDPTGDGRIEITDPIVIVRWAFLGEEAPVCLESADSNDDGRVDITDPIHILRFFFLGDEPPADPFAACGEDPTPDGLGCGAYPPCGG